MRSWIALALPLSMLVGCSHTGQQQAGTAKPAPTVNATPQVAPAQATTLAGNRLGMACSVDGDCLSTQLCSNAVCKAITANMPECGLARVHFDFDKADLHDGEEPTLDRAARCIMAEQKVHVLVTGNADERGTEEYNLALGDRRANAVATYLEHRGVSPLLLRTVSYGKDQPLCREHTESCWTENRRSAVKSDDRVGLNP
jgi:peptidoglycan-associated lipoprotein